MNELIHIDIEKSESSKPTSDKKNRKNDETTQI